MVSLPQASSAHGSPMLLQPLKQTCEYCTEQIPFPSFSILEDDNSLKECYVMENPQEPDAPIVAYFPLISDTFQKYKAPGKPPLCCMFYVQFPPDIDEISWLGHLA